MYVSMTDYFTNAKDHIVFSSDEQVCPYIQTSFIRHKNSSNRYPSEMNTESKTGQSFVYLACEFTTELKILENQTASIAALSEELYVSCNAKLRAFHAVYM